MTNIDQARNFSCKALGLLALLLGTSACVDLDVKDKPPVARARALVNGAPVVAGMDIPYAGAPIAVTLDASESSDPDGRITRFQWLQNVPSSERFAGYAGAGTGVPAPFPGDPASTTQTATVMLGEGTFSYSVIVTDDQKLTGGPATVSFTIKTPSMYTPDAACVAAAANDSEGCKNCICSPNSTTGCLEQWQACYANTDAMFVTLCRAVVDCALANDCVGSACYTAAFCMTQIDAAATYMGGTLADCSMGSAMTNPCAAASQLGTCTNAAMPMAPMTGACGMACM